MVIEVTASDIAPWFKLIQMRFKGIDLNYV